MISGLPEQAMYVIKRNGKRERLYIDKITARLDALMDGLDTNHVFPETVSQKISASLFPGITTSQIDELAAETAGNMVCHHRDYSILASRILISNLHKNTPSKFSEAMEKANVRLPIPGQGEFGTETETKHLDFLQPEFLETVRKNKDFLDGLNSEELKDIVQHSNDYEFDYFGIQTLINNFYLMTDDQRKVVERPQHLFLRVALTLHPTDMDMLFKTYRKLCECKYIHATPTLFHAGKKDGNLASCFIAGTSVLTDSGPKPIETVCIGDKVITHTGKWKPVTQLHKNPLDGRTIFNLRCTNTEQIYVTGNHRLWIITRDDLTPRWVAVDKLPDDSFVAMPYRRAYEDFVEKQKVDEWTIDVNEDYATFVGIWFAKGHVLQDHNQPFGISISIDETNEKMLNWLKTKVPKIFGIDIDVVKSFDVLDVCLHSSGLGSFFKQSFGPDFSTRHLHKSMYQWPPNLVKAFMTEFMNWGLVTKRLCKEMYHLFRSIGQVVTYHREFGNTPGIYRLHHSFVSSSEEKKPVIRMADGQSFVKIISAKDMVYGDLPLYVYTLGVQDDHSYAVEGIIAENCFLLHSLGDSLEQIFDTLKQCAMISKVAGGVGLAVHNIRAKGSLIKSSRRPSDGLAPKMLKLFEATARYVDQSGKRKGGFAIYLEPHHADIFDFLDLRKNTGSDQQRCRDLFTALWVSDLFMKRVEDDAMWSLFSEDTAPGMWNVWGDEYEKLYCQYEQQGRAVKTIKARTLWTAILDAQRNTGTPYITYKDTCNRKSNQQNLGTIKSSNLCVHGDTPLLTRTGVYPIKDLKNKSVEVWNGKMWSKVTVKMTNPKTQMHKIEFSDGGFLICTDYHKFCLFGAAENKEIIRCAKDLKVGDKLCIYNLPQANSFQDNERDFPHAYLHGFWCEHGTYNPKDLTPPRISTVAQNRLKLVCTKEIILELPAKFTVPINYSRKSKLEWLAGYFDGAAVKSGSIIETIIASDYNFLSEIRLLLQTFGIVCKIKKDWDMYVQLFDEHNTKLLAEMILPFRRLHQKLQVSKSGEETNTHTATVTSVTPNFVTNVPSYCFTEELEGKGVFNGYLTKNCSEIIEYTDAKQIAVCNLCSINLAAHVVEQEDSNPYFDFDELYETVYLTAQNLNRVIDITQYPLPEAQFSNLQNRPIGIGVQSLAHAFIKMRYPYASAAAKQLNKDIFETMYWAAMNASCDQAKKDGPYNTFAGSPLSKGLFQFDLWGVKPSSNRYNWQQLREDVIKFGVRNSLLIALMPTASTSQILGGTESFEPISSTLYVRRTQAGEFIILDKYLVRDLSNLGLWKPEVIRQLVANRGSVQKIAEIPDDIKELYKTVFEISMKDQIDMSADRGIYVCQSQSFNVHMEDVSDEKLTKMHFYGWKKGLKTGMYYLRTKPLADPIQFTVDHQLTLTNSSNNQKQVESGAGLVCKKNDPNCESCSA